MTQKRQPSHMDTFPAYYDHILQITSQSIAEDVTITGQLWSKHVKNDI